MYNTFKKPLFSGFLNVNRRRDFSDSNQKIFEYALLLE